MRTAAGACAAALYYAQHHLYVRSGMCDHYVGVYYGLAHSGYYTAVGHFNHIPTRYRHGRTAAPAGALCFWGGGSHGAGHIALSLGSGLIASTDFPRNHYVGVVPVGAIHTHWGLYYLGWTDAWYGSQGVVVVANKTPVPSGIPKVSLAHIQTAARRDPGLPAGGTTFPTEVKYVEHALRYLGYLPLTYANDGSYGNLTVRAYSHWQEHLGYKGAAANGIPGRDSLTKLGKATPYKFVVV